MSENETTGGFDVADAIRRIEEIHVTDDVYMRIRGRFDRHLDTVAAGAKEARAFVIAAESGAGKTHTISNLIAARRFDPTSEVSGERRPVITVTAPAPCTSKTLGLEIYENMTGSVLPTRTLEHEIWRLVRGTARILGVEVLVIDEMHHLFDAKNDKDIAAVLATLKRLLVGEIDDRRRPVATRPITLVLAGMPTLKSVLARDLQVQRRCIVETISADGNDEASRRAQTKFLSLVEKRLSEILGKQQSLSGADVTMRIVAASASYRGRMCVLLKEAAKMAVMDGSREIDVRKHLAVVFREIWFVDDVNNPFLMSDVGRFVFPKSFTRDIPTKLRGKKKEEA